MPTTTLAPAPTATTLPPAASPRPWTITATLCAARSEADGSIQLVVADPAGRPNRLRVSFAPAYDPACSAPPALKRRARAARARFEEEIVSPPFEGHVLLYGDARLTLVQPDGGYGPERPAPYVLDFEPAADR